MFIVVWHSPAKAQTGFIIQVRLHCNATEVILGMLKDKYREVATGGGMSSSEQIRLFESHDAGDKQTWTLVLSNPNGQSCIMKGGEDWISDDKIIKGDPM